MKKHITLLTLVFTFCIYSFPIFSQGDNIVVHADQMPYFPGCGKLKNGSDKKRECSNEMLVAFLSHNVQYPASAKTEETEGTVYVSFIIDENGKVTQPSIIRDIGNGCGAAAVDVLKKMPDWQPGKHEGKIVKVKLNLPIHFYLKNGISNPVEADDYKITWGTLKSDQIPIKNFKNNLEKIIMVRDRFGDPVSFSELTFSYQKGNKFQTATSNGVLNKKQKKIIKKAKVGGQFYIEVLVNDENKKIKVGREFEIVE